SVATARGLLLGISLIIIWFVFLESLQDGVLGVIRQEGHQPIPGSLEHHAGFGSRDPVPALLVRHQPGEEQERHDDDQKPPGQRKQARNEQSTVQGQVEGCYRHRLDWSARTSKVLSESVLGRRPK